MFTLSKSERGMLGLEDAPAKPAQSQPVLSAGSARVVPPPPPAPAPVPDAQPEAKQGRSWWKLW
jgi:hypothetical protein